MTAQRQPSGFWVERITEENALDLTATKGMTPRTRWPYYRGGCKHCSDDLVLSIDKNASFVITEIFRHAQAVHPDTRLEDFTIDTNWTSKIEIFTLLQYYEDGWKYALVVEIPRTET